MLPTDRSGWQAERVIVDCAAYVDGERMDFDPTPENLRAWADRPDAFVWLGLRMPHEDELGAACDALLMDTVSPQELLRPHLRPVLTVDGPLIHMVLRTARYEDDREVISLGEMTVLVGPRAVITVRHGQASPLGALRASLEEERTRLRHGPMGVVAAVINRVIEDYGPALDGFENDAVEVEREVFSDTRQQPVKRLYTLKREVRELLVAIDALQDPLLRLIRIAGPKVAAEVHADLSEAADQLDRTVTRTMSLSSLLDAALTASLAQISVQQNADMRRISAWVAMAAVPTLIAGIYGMNFENLPELQWELGYPFVLLVMGGVVGTMYRAFKRGGWF
jgi:magnesium transporter